MSNNGLTDTNNEEKLLLDLQKAMRDNDFDKIDALMKAPEESPETAPGGETPAEVPAPVTTEEPTASPADETTAEAGSSNPDAEVQPTQDSASTIDPVAEIAALKQKLEAATQQLHRYKSDAGRVPALQKRMAELEKRLNPTDKDATDSSKLDAPSDDEKRVLEDLRANDPVLAEHIDKLMSGMRKTNGALRQQFEERLREADKQDYQQIVEELERIEYDRLQDMLPDVDLQRVFRSPEWSQWKATLRPSDRAYAESANAEEVYAAINWFATAVQQRQNQTAAPAVSAPTPAAAPVVPTPTPAVAPKTKQSVAAQQPGRSLSDDELFSQAWKEIGERDGLNQPKLR